MAFNALYDYGHNDTFSIANYIEGFLADGLGVADAKVDADALSGIVQSSYQEFPYNNGDHKSASPFKKVACFTCYFVALRPIAKPFPADKIGPNLAAIDNHQNAIAAYLLSVDSLHKATIHRADGVVELANKITVSRHSFCDIIDAIASATPLQSFKSTAALYEQLAYRANPQASYPPEI